MLFFARIFGCINARNICKYALFGEYYAPCRKFSRVEIVLVRILLLHAQMHLRKIWKGRKQNDENENKTVRYASVAAIYAAAFFVSAPRFILRRMVYFKK